MANNIEHLKRLESHCIERGLNPDKYVQMLEDGMDIVAIVDQIADDLMEAKP